VPALDVLDGVRWHGVEVAGARSRRLLAVLAAAAPHAVPASRLVEQVWTDDPPEHPEKALQVLVSRTRSRTAPDVVERTGVGYRLGLDPAAVDVLELSRLVGEARAAAAAGDQDLVRVCAEAALAIPLGDGPDDPVTGELVAGSLDDRTAAQELLGAACLARGDHARALELLEPLLERRPADEELLARVLRAEAAARGVPAALARYAAYAERTRDRLGAEPGDRLRRLHLDLLAREAPVREGLTYDAVPMVGRDHDVTAIRELLDGSRVVSIVGPGGLGKTRMAHLVGHLADQPVVRLVELAGVNGPDGVLPEVATALGVRDALSRPLQAGAANDLRGRIAQQLLGAPALLVMDNCEHLVEAVADLVAFLVATVPDLRVLTTSRAPLGIGAERVYLLPQLEPDAAVEVFRQRALSARPGVRLDDDEVRALVDRLDGLPLAIELAAAKVRVMSVAEVSRRLGDRFALLRGGDRSAPDRHQTLEAVIDWSWQLLPDPPRLAMRALSVFPDGFSLAGAEAVLGRDALSDIGHLAEQSLMVVREDESLRYRLLETVREYAGHRLEEAGERDAVEERLSAWAVATARSLADGLTGPDQIETVTAAREEAGNLTGVLRRAIDRRDAETVVPLLATLAPYWTIRGDHASVFSLAAPVQELLADFRPATGEVDELRTVLAEMALGTLIVGGDMQHPTRDRLRELGHGPPGSRGHGISRMLLAMFDGNDIGTLQALADDEDPGVAMTALVWMTQIQENSGELEAARATSERALSRVDESAGPWMRALAESQLAGLAFQAGDTDAALGSMRRALPTMEALGALDDCVQLRSMEALAELTRGDVAAAERALDAMASDERARRSLAWTFGANGLAELALAKGDAQAGLQLYRESVDAAQSRSMPGLDLEIGLTPWVLFSKSCALVAYVQHDRAVDAADLAHDLERRLPQLFANGHRRLDIPVAGGVLFAVGQWRLVTGTADPADAARLLVLAERFGYYRGIPSMSWDRAVALAEHVAPGVLDRLEAEYAGRAVSDLTVETAGLVRGALP
jgi:predicted ATPase/DNA-binding SARP family transcriptional activator